MRAWAVLRASSVESRFEALHAERSDRPCRARRRIGIAASALVESKGRSRPSGAAFRRGRHRQIAAHGRAFGTPRQRAACALALFLLAAAHRQRVLSDHRPNGTCRRNGARRYPANEARQARRHIHADLDLYRGRGALCRHAVAPERWTLSRARSRPATAPTTDTRGGPFAHRGAGTARPRADDLRGRALDRPHEP